MVQVAIDNNLQYLLVGFPYMLGLHLFSLRLPKMALHSPSNDSFCSMLNLAQNVHMKSPATSCSA
jgi:hypothetical protein